MKEMKNVVLTQSPEVFRDKETGKDIAYMQYSVIVAGRAILVKPVNATSKVRLSDAFENIK